jgi:HEAT repeat protein
MLERAIENLRSDDEETWRQAKRWLFFSRTSEMIERLISALDDRHPRVRESAAETLGFIPDPRSVDALITRLSDAAKASWRSIGATAAWALGEIGDLRAVEPLIGVLDAPHSGIQREAIQALAKLADPRAVEPLIRVMVRSYDPSIPTILSNFGADRAVEPLINLLQTPPETRREQHWYSAFRYYAVRALGKLGDKRALPILEKMHEAETVLVFKGKSIRDAATKAIERIKVHNPL